MAERVKLRDWWPAILVSPLVLCLPLVWMEDRDAVSTMRAVDARIVKVEEYKCSMSSSVRRGHARRPCWEITREYRAADGKLHHKIDYQRGNSRPRKGDWSSVLVNTAKSGGIPDGTDEMQASHGPLGYSIFATGFFAVACYASVLRARRRLERERAAGKIKMGAAPVS